MKNKNVRFITYTALFLSMLVIVQYITKPLGQVVTGTGINFLLIAAAVLGGVASGVVVAIVSPFLAFLFGIGTPIIQITALIALGNLALVLTYVLLFKFLSHHQLIKWFTTVVTAAVIKFAVLYYTIVKGALYLMPNLSEKQASALSVAFGGTQFLTAVFGGFLTFIVIPLVSKSLNNKNI